MSHFRNGHLIESLAEGGYQYAVPDGYGGWVLTDQEGEQELWVENPGHAGYTIVLPTGEELEFVRNV